MKLHTAAGSKPGIDVYYADVNGNAYSVPLVVVGP